MPAPQDLGLDRRRRDLVRRALDADPALGSELELITALLEREARDEFWRAFADGCERAERPATAVLRALELAAAHPPTRRGAPSGSAGFSG